MNRPVQLAQSTEARGSHAVADFHYSGSLNRAKYRPAIDWPTDRHPFHLCESVGPAINASHKTPLNASRLRKRLILKGKTPMLITWG